jgi:hypothetical protein
MSRSSRLRRAPSATLRPLLLLPVLAVLGGPAGAAELPLTRVVLSTAGLAQFTHQGTAAAGSSIDLPVRLDQVDDVLKSLTVFDAAGAIGPVGLAGRQPLEELFRDLPFDRDALASPTELVNALVGAEVEIAGPVTARGRIFRVEAETATSPEGRDTVIRHRLSLLTDKGLVQAIFEEITALSFTDPAARAQIDRAFAGLAENRAKDRRTLSVGVLGSGSRPMAIAYVVAAPIWKTSWRLVLPATGKARLQGWAVLENLTGGDWKGVDLTLVSGNPVALTQPLYTPIWGERTTVPVSTGAAIRPPSDSGRVAKDVRGKVAEAAAERAEAVPALAGAPAPAPMMRLTAAPPPPPMAPGAAAEARDAATRLVFHFPAPVTLPTGHSLMLPFVDREIAAERVWVYRPGVDRTHPLAALRLVNDGATALPGGIVTAFETSQDGVLEHVGDAVLPLVGKDESRFLSFALDARTTVRREDRGIRRTTVGTVADGALSTTVRSRRVVAYEVTAPADEARTVIVEEARSPGWTPADGAVVEDTPSHHRLRIVAAAGEVAKAEFAVERVETQTVTLATLSAEDVLARVKGLDNAGPALKAAIERLSGIVAEIARLEAQKSAGAAERDRIGTDQERIRANLQSVGAASDLGRRYVETMKTQESRLAEIDRAERTATETIAARRREAADLVRTLKP